MYITQMSSYDVLPVSPKKPTPYIYCLYIARRDVVAKVRLLLTIMVLFRRYPHCGGRVY